MELAVGYNKDFGIGIGPKISGFGILPVLVFTDWEALEKFIDMLVEFYTEQMIPRTDIPDVFLKEFEENE